MSYTNDRFRRKPDHIRLSRTIVVKVRDQEFGEIAAEADREECPISHVVRRRLFGEKSARPSPLNEDENKKSPATG